MKEGEMLRILAIISDLGPISKDRKQTIQLSEVAEMTGDYCQGQMRNILFLTAEEDKVVMNFLKSRKGAL